MADRILTLRELNRATLARQMLLERADLPITAGIERQVGLQAQQALSPYVALWTRLQNFQREQLADLIAQRVVVKATLMRATLHLCTAADYVRLRGAIQPALDLAVESIVKRREPDLDTEHILTLARPYLAEQPRTFAEISEHFANLLPDIDIGAIRYTIRTQLPLIQLPNSSLWSYPGNPQFTLAEDWLGQPIPLDNDPRTLFFRYLAAFGPASITDMQKWSGQAKLKDVIAKFKPELVTYRDEQRRELFDLPDQPLPDVDSPAPVRFLPEYDNLLLAHDKRTRIIDDAYRSQVYLPGLRVRSTFLVDGFVRGGWKIEKKKQAATLLLEPFAALSKAERGALLEEGEQLIRFVEADAKSYAVHFTD